MLSPIWLEKTVPISCVARRVPVANRDDVRPACFRRIRWLATMSFGVFGIITAGQAPLAGTVTGTPAPSVAPAVELSTLWEVLVGTDYTSSVNPTEFTEPYLGLFYLPTTFTDVLGKTALPDVQPLYRLLNSAGTDHMDSPTAGEGGYGTQETLGYVWSTPSAEFGLSSIVRQYDSQSGSANVGDHATTEVVAPIPHPQALAYYSPEGPIGNGYARYPGTDNALAWLAGGGVVAKNNLAVGCALWEWWWNGTEFINDYDYGRQIQVALYPADGTSALGEAGDSYGGPSIAVDFRHPSPCVTFSTGASSTGPYQTTAAVPLEWAPLSLGGGASNPVIYPSVRLGKTLTLDWIGPDNEDRNWPVALFQTQIVSSGISLATVEAPTGYLTSAFNTYYYYNPVTKVLTQVPQTTVYCDTFGYTSTNGCPTNSPTTGFDVPLTASSPQAIIVANSTGTLAMGVYINNPNSGFVFYDNSTGTSPGQAGSNFVKWEVHYYSSISAGTWTYNTWIMTGTLQNVETYMNQLYTWGVTSK